MLETLTANTFSPYIDSTFRIFPNSGPPLDLVLSTVTEVDKSYGSASPRTPFSVLFHGPMNPVLQQQIYRVEHDEMETLEIFLVPLGPDREGMRYEAVFS